MEGYKEYQYTGIDDCAMSHVEKPRPFEEFLRERGIKRKLMPIATPKQNGKVERYHRTDDEEFYDQQGFSKPEKRRKKLARYMDYYNKRRPHQALGWMTPLQNVCKTGALTTELTARPSPDKGWGAEGLPFLLPLAK